MRYYYINETFTTQRRQRIFKINKPFDTELVSVYVDGELMECGENADYVTIPDTGKIIFNNRVPVGSTVQVTSTAMTKKLDVQVITNDNTGRKNALYKKYGTLRRLKVNNLYNVQICIDKEFTRWSFMSEMSPMFATVKQVRQQIGKFIEDVTDSQIELMLYANSVKVVELIDQLANQEEPVENVTYEVDANGIYSTTYRAVKNWVLYQTCIDLIYYIYYGIAIRYGSIKKIIGDIDIERNVKLPYLDDLLDRLKDLWEDADEEIRGVDIVKSFVKAIDKYKYTDWERTTNF